MFRRLRILVTLLMLLALVHLTGVALAKPQVHRVADKQTLGKIAKRYRVTVDALKHANDLRGKLIKPGQKLLIPPRSDPDGSKTRAFYDERKKADGKAAGKKNGARAKSSKPGKVRWHVVAKRQRLGSIAKRYGVTLEAIRHANDIGEKSVIKPGQRLIVPAKDDLDGSRARKERLAAAARADAGLDAPRKQDSGKTDESWAPYVRKPSRRNYVDLRGRVQRSWRGTVLTRKGNVRKAAKEAFARVLATRAGDEHAIDPRLIAMVAKLSNTFGGSAIHVVSGYRLGKTSKTSRHRQGRAIDLRIAGVPNTALRDYLKTFDNVGVGYYPNSHFVHLDVRDQWTYWIDYSGPGQRPRYGGFWTRGPSKKVGRRGDH